MSDGNAQIQEQLFTYALTCAYSYFNEQCDKDLKPIVDAFKEAHYFNSAEVSELNSTSSDLDSLTFIPFVAATEIENLKSKLSNYLAKTKALLPDIELIAWWKICHTGQANAAFLSSC